MASITYLWKNRAKFSPLNILFYKAWAKRVLTFPELLKRNFRAYKLTLKGAQISDFSEIGKVIVTGKKKKLNIGHHTFIGSVEIALHEKVDIGNYVCINDGVLILSGSHDVLDPKWNHIKAEIRIEDYVWIGTQAMILPGVHIGRGAVIGARAVVSKSVKPGEIVIGNPAKVLSKKRDIQFNYSPCEFVAANRAWLIG